jgi:hypothetical protein
MYHDPNKVPTNIRRHRTKCWRLDKLTLGFVRPWFNGLLKVAYQCKTVLNFTYVTEDLQRGGGGGLGWIGSLWTLRQLQPCLSAWHLRSVQTKFLNACDHLAGCNSVRCLGYVPRQALRYTQTESITRNNHFAARKFHCTGQGCPKPGRQVAASTNFVRKRLTPASPQLFHAIFLVPRCLCWLLDFLENYEHPWYMLLSIKRTLFLNNTLWIICTANWREYESANTQLSIIVNLLQRETPNEPLEQGIWNLARRRHTKAYTTGVNYCLWVSSYKHADDTKLWG